MKDLAKSASPFAFAVLAIGFAFVWSSEFTTKAAPAHHPLIVPGRPNSATIFYDPGLDGGRTTSKNNPAVIRNQKTVGELAQTLNGLTRAPRGAINCPMDNGRSFVIHFGYQDGDRWTVTVQASGCRFVSSMIGLAWYLDGPIDVGGNLMSFFR